MNTFAVVILVALVGEYLLGAVSGLLSSRSFGPEVPAEFTGVFNDDKYTRARRYTATRVRFGLVRGALGLAAMLTFWFAGGFAWLDSVVRGLGKGPVVTGLVYIGAIILAGTLFQLPFRAWSTFVIEGRYGFNRTTAGTFGADLLKGAAVAIFLGGPLLAVILAFFEIAGPLAWIWCWIAVTTFTLAVQFIGPTWIMPLFNTFTPLDDGKLHDAILGYARSAGFPLEGIFVVDGSRRSSKPNAFFTGFGKHKRIGLFDTLVEEYAVAEVVAGSGPRNRPPQEAPRLVAIGAVDWPHRGDAVDLVALPRAAGPLRCVRCRQTVCLRRARVLQPPFQACGLGPVGSHARILAAARVRGRPFRSRDYRQRRASGRRLEEAGGRQP